MFTLVARFFHFFHCAIPQTHPHTAKIPRTPLPLPLPLSIPLPPSTPFARSTMKTVGDRLRDPTWWRYGSYAFDWILCIVLIAVFLYLDSVDPFHREFSVQNPAIMYSYRPTDSVPAWSLIVISVAGPVVLILLIGLGIRHSPYDVHNGVLGLLVSVLLTTMITQVIKVHFSELHATICFCLFSFPLFFKSSRWLILSRGGGTPCTSPQHGCAIELCGLTPYALYLSGHLFFLGSSIECPPPLLRGTFRVCVPTTPCAQIPLFFCFVFARSL